MSQRDPGQGAAGHDARLLRVAVARDVSRVSDEMGDRVSKIADGMVRVEFDNTQVRSLENLAYGTDKISDITDWIKRQIGRAAKDKPWCRDNVGQDLLTTLVSLRSKADRIAAELGKEPFLAEAVDDDLPRRIHLDLCRELIRHLTAEFLYVAKTREKEHELDRDTSTTRANSPATTSGGVE